MPTFVLRLIAPRPNFAQTMTDAEREIMNRHAAHWRPYLERGDMVVFGPILTDDDSYGLAALATAESISGSEFSGPYVIQAALAACHARALVAADTDWIRIATLYGVLASLAPSPVIELNRAVAVSMVDGPAVGLAIVDTLAGEPALRGYHLLPSARGDLLERLGRRDEARAEFRRAAAMTANTSERAHLLARAAACG